MLYMSCTAHKPSLNLPLRDFLQCFIYCCLLYILSLHISLRNRPCHHNFMRSNVNVIKCNWMQLKAPNHRTIVAKCTDLRHQEPGLQLKQRNDKGLRRAVQAIQFQYMFHVQAFLQPNLHQIVPQVRILDKQNIFGHPCRHMLASKMPTVKWYSSYIIHHGQ